MLMRRPQGLHTARALHSPLASRMASQFKFQAISPYLGPRARASLLRCNRLRLIPRGDAYHMIPIMRHHLLSAWLSHASTKAPSADTPHPCGPCLAEGRNSLILVSAPLKESYLSIRTYNAPSSLNDIWAIDLDASPICHSCLGTMPFFHALC